MRILLTEGSGLASRQIATRLDELGHDVSAAVSDPLCLARFTRHVRPLRARPAVRAGPPGLVRRRTRAAGALGVEVVFPTQEQVTVLSHQLPRLTAAGLSTAVPPSPRCAGCRTRWPPRRTLAEVGVAQPRSVVVRRPGGAAEWAAFPAYVKAPVGTASTGVRRVEGPGQLDDAVRGFLAAGAREDGGVAGAGGRGRGAGHGPERLRRRGAGRLPRQRTGARGGERQRIGQAQRGPAVPALEPGATGPRAGTGTGHSRSTPSWTADGPLVIDVNPRLVEPGNALAAGTDLVGGAARRGHRRTGAPARHRRGPGCGPTNCSWRVLGAAQQHRASRRTVAAELARALRPPGCLRAVRSEELLPAAGRLAHAGPARGGRGGDAGPPGVVPDGSPTAPCPATRSAPDGLATACARPPRHRTVQRSAQLEADVRGRRSPGARRSGARRRATLQVSCTR